MQFLSLSALSAFAALSVLTPCVRAETPPRLEVSEFGKTSGGQTVKRVTLRNPAGMKAEIITYGAVLKELLVPDRSGRFANVVLTADTLEQYEMGFNAAAAVIGRVVNRIGGAQFELDGTTYPLPANSGKNTIHGGKKGFDQSVWTVAHTATTEQEASASLHYLSKDGEEGFPGNLDVTVTYTLTGHNELRMDYRATTDRPTIANLTSHAYWNLAGGGSCLDQVLWIPATRYTVNDADLIPTGEILPLAGTPMDFSRPTRIGDRMAELKPNRNGYDHNYILPGGKGLKMAARLTDPGSGRIMEVLTTQPAVQLYTGNHVGNTAVCLETQHYPDAIHHDHFPSIVIRPGQPLEETTVFTFLTE